MSQPPSSFDYYASTGWADNDYASQACHVCGASDFRIIAGFLSCTVCGTQAQDFQETQEEFTQTQGNQGNFFRRRVRLPASVKKQEGRAPGEEVRAAGDGHGPSTSGAGVAGGDAVAHLKSLQGLLARQADALVLHLGCRGALKDTVRKIWLRMVDTNEDIRALNEEEGSGDREGPEAAQRRQTLAKAIVEAFPVQRSVAVLMLAALVSREPVLPIDLTKLIMTAKMPLLKGDLISQTTMWATDKVLCDAVKLSRTLGLPHQKINVGGLVARFVKELQLPPDIALHARKLHACLPEEVGKYLSISENTSRSDLGGLTFSGSPYPYVAGLLLVTLKVLFGLDGRKAANMPVQSWTAWAAKRLESNGGLNSGPWHPWLVDTSSVIGMPRQEVSAYADFLKKHLFPEGAPESMRSAYNLLKGIARRAPQGNEGGERPPQRTPPATYDPWDDPFAEPPRLDGDDGGGVGDEVAGADASYVVYADGCASFHVDYQAVVLTLSHVSWVKPSFIHHATARLERLLLLAEGQQQQ